MSLVLNTIKASPRKQTQEFQVLGIFLYLQFFTGSLDSMSGSCWGVMVMGPVWEWLGVGGQGAWFSLRS